MKKDKVMKNNVLNVKVSLFKNAKANIPLRTVTLYDWLVSEENKRLISRLRLCKDIETKKKLKENLPCITPSGVFTTRAAKNLVNHSGIICIDIDKKGNEDLENFSEMKDLIQVLDCVAYCSLSASGEGYFVLIPIKEPDKHKEHFERLKLDFAACGIVIDKGCSDVSRLRFASYDEKPYINLGAKQYYRGIGKKQMPQIKKRNNSKKVKEQVNSLIDTIDLLGIDITGKYDDWFAIGCSIAKEYGESGRELFHTVSKFHVNYSHEETDKKYSDCLNVPDNKFSIGTLFFYAKEHGIALK